METSRDKLCIYDILNWALCCRWAKKFKGTEELAFCIYVLSGQWKHKTWHAVILLVLHRGERTDLIIEACKLISYNAENSFANHSFKSKALNSAAILYSKNRLLFISCSINKQTNKQKNHLMNHVIIILISMSSSKFLAYWKSLVPHWGKGSFDKTVSNHRACV